MSESEPLSASIEVVWVGVQRKAELKLSQRTPSDRRAEMSSYVMFRRARMPRQDRIPAIRGCLAPGRHAQALWTLIFMSR